MRVFPGEPSGRIGIQGSKSITQRFVLISTFAGNTLHLRNVSFCEDDLTSISIAASCGRTWKRSGSDLLVRGDYRPPAQIDCRDSGTSLRLSLGLLAGRRCKTRIRMSGQLSARPRRQLVDSLSENGVTFSEEGSFLYEDATDATQGRSLIGGGISSQFVSSLLLFQSHMDADRKVVVQGDMVSGGYVTLTIDALRKFGIDVHRESETYTLSGGYSQKEVEHVVEGDYSSAAYMIALGTLASGAGVRIHGINLNSAQPDARILGLIPGLERHFDSGELVVSKTIPEMATVDCNITPDLAPVASVIGLFSKNGAHILNGYRLRSKESDRLSDIKRLVSLFGGNLREEDGDLHISPGAKTGRVELLNFSEHRMIMAGVIAGILSGQAIEHRNVEQIHKSYPRFLEDLASLGIGVEPAD